MSFLDTEVPNSTWARGHRQALDQYYPLSTQIPITRTGSIGVIVRLVSTGRLKPLYQAGYGLKFSYGGLLPVGIAAALASVALA
jgi:hypothetical protein